MINKGIKFEIKRWRIYLVKHPYWDKNTNDFSIKVRPMILYNFCGDNALFIPLTSNLKYKDSGWTIPIKLKTESLIIVNNITTLNIKAIMENKWCYRVDDKNRNQIELKIREFVLNKTNKLL